MDKQLQRKLGWTTRSGSIMDVPELGLRWCNHCLRRKPVYSVVSWEKRVCGDCRHLKRRAHRFARGEFSFGQKFYNRPDLGLRYCTRCHRMLPDTGTWMGQQCAPCVAGQQAVYHRLRDCEEFRQAQRIYGAQYRADNPGKIKAKNERYERRPEVRAKKRVRNSRRAGIYKSSPDIKDAALYDLRYNKQQGRCAYCGIDLDQLPSKQVHLDHIVPLSREGATPY